MFTDDIRLQIDLVAGPFEPNRRRSRRRGYDIDSKPVVAKPGHGQRDPVHRDRTFQGISFDDRP